MHVLQVEPEIIANHVATGQVRLAFHHVLDHGDASRLAHRAAECAGSQSPLAFWQMHGLLYARQSELWQADEALMVQWAEELGLADDAFSTCMAEPEIAAKVTRMDEERRAAGIRQRPSFDLNGEIIQGAAPYTLFAQQFAAP